MSATIEFYAADPGQIRSVFELEDFDQWYEAKSSLPVADLSLHLDYPKDLDALVEACRQFGLDLSKNSFTALILETIWDDGEGSAKLQKLDSSFNSLGLAVEESISKIAKAWGESFEDSTASLRAVRELKEVCEYAAHNGQSVVLYTCY